MNRTYELMFIVRPDMPEEDQEKLISTLESAVNASGGAIKKVERMGKRRLAYTVRRFFEGVYLLLTIEGSGGLVHELERRLRVNDLVIKFMTVRIDENLKRIEKRKKQRDKRAARRPAPVVPQPSVAQQMLGGVEKPTSVPGLPVPGAPAPAQPVAAPAQPVPNTEES